jgi:endonuclease/exonuclease/phosphatase (EEP) superfamily protein YafD
MTLILPQTTVRFFRDLLGCGVVSARTVLGWVLVVPWAVWAIVRIGSLDRGWPLIGIVAFTPWAVVGAILGGAAAWALKRRVAAIVAGVAALLLILAIAPRVVGDGEGGALAAGDRPLRVLTLNVMGSGARADAVVDLVRRTRADVLSVQELTPEAEEALEDAGLRLRLRNAMLRPRPAGFGTGVYTRLPLRPGRPPGGTWFAMTSAIVRAAGGRDVEVLAVHIRAPTGSNAIADWQEDLRALPRASERRLRVLAGDFNATLDHHELRRVIDRGYVDAAASAGVGLHTTWPLGRVAPPTVTIDHVLADERFAIGEVSIHEVPGSDHRAVFAQLVLERGG